MYRNVYLVKDFLSGSSLVKMLSNGRVVKLLHFVNVSLTFTLAPKCGVTQGLPTVVVSSKWEDGSSKREPVGLGGVWYVCLEIFGVE